MEINIKESRTTASWKKSDGNVSLINMVDFPMKENWLFMVYFKMGNKNDK